MTFSQSSDAIDDEIKKNFSDADNVKQSTRDAGKFLSRGFKLPLGVSMRAYHIDKNGNIYPPEALAAWNESVTLLVDQKPNYLDAFRPDPSNPRLYTLKLRNTNLLGPAGLHVLPTLEPWIATVNMWLIDVEGEFVKFKVQDMDNEVHPDPIFGHEAQVYVRERIRIKDPITNSIASINLWIDFPDFLIPFQ